MEYIIILILTISIIRIVFTIITSLKSKGRIGEDIVKYYLSELDEEYKVINDVLLKRKNGMTSQIDHIVISQYGIFVIETKNYTGTIIGSDEAREWIQKIGKYRNKFYNPVKQNIGHIYTLKELLDKYTNIPYISIVLFTHKAVLNLSKSNDWKSYIDYTYNVVGIIKRYSKKRISSAEVLDIYKLIKDKNITNYKQRKLHIKNMKNHMKKIETESKEKYPWF